MMGQKNSCPENKPTKDNMTLWFAVPDLEKGVIDNNDNDNDNDNDDNDNDNDDNDDDE